MSLGPRDRAALQVLVLRRGSPVRTDTIAEALWGQDQPASAGKVVQGCVVRIRKALGPASVETTEGGYLLRLHGDEVDAPQFEELLERARRLLGDGQPDRAHYVVARATDLWRGEPFVDLADWEPARIEAGRLVEQLRDAEDLTAEVALALGRHEEVARPDGRPRARAADPGATVGTARPRAVPLRPPGRRPRDAPAGTHPARDRARTRPGPRARLAGAGHPAAGPVPRPPAPRRPPGETCPYPGLLSYDVGRRGRRSSAGTPTSRPACAGSTRRGCSRSSGRPGAGSPRCCEPAWPPPCSRRPSTSPCSPRARSRSARSTGVPAGSAHRPRRGPVRGGLHRANPTRPGRS